MRTIGLIGGMSWESSADYYAAINRGVAAHLGGLHSARSVMVSVDFAEIEQLQRNGEWEEAGRRLATEARQAEAAGAACIVLCTNTMHKVAEAVASAVDVPLLHIADATGERLVADGRRSVGLLGTRYTMEQDFYRERLAEQFDLEVLVPDASDRARIDGIIFDELVRGAVRDDSRARYLAVIDRLTAAGAEAVILGCTEIGMLVNASHTNVPLYDTTAIHAEAAVAFALGEDGGAARG